MKTGIAALCEGSGLNAAFRFRNRGLVKILLYHSIVRKADWKAGIDPFDQCVPDEEFETHMAYLKKKFEIISPSDILANRFSSSKINVVITFDDGFMNNFLVAFPILKKYSVKATFFLTTSFISKKSVPWFLKLSAEEKIKARDLEYAEFSKKVRDSSLFDDKDFFGDTSGVFYPMGWDEVKELAREDIVTIGSHASSHIPLTKLPDKAAEKELRSSKEEIEQNIKKEISSVSYPHGYTDKRIARLAEKCGYKIGITTRHGFNTLSTARFLLKRNEVGNGGDIGIFKCTAAGSWDFLKGLHGKA